jgi:hypothetical protein
MEQTDVGQSEMSITRAAGGRGWEFYNLCPRPRHPAPVTVTRAGWPTRDIP